MRKILIGSVVAATMLTTASMAANIATDGTGEYLLGGRYFAQNGFQTEVKLVNTNLFRSVVMRVVVREFTKSNEVDFTVTLSPGDVWTGVLRDVAGVPYVFSDDDSNYRVSESRISQGNGVAMNTESLGGNFRKGYIEVLPMFAYDHSAGTADGIEVNRMRVNNEDTGILIAEKVPKEAQRGRFSLYGFVDAFTRNSVTNDYTFNGFNYAADGIDTNTTTTGAVGPVLPDDVYGEVSITNTNFEKDFVGTLPMLAVENLTNDYFYTVTGGGFHFDTMKPGENTEMNNYLSTTDVRDIYNSLVISSVTVPFENSGIDQDVKFAWWYDQRGNNNGEVFDVASDQRRYFDVVLRNMTEDRPATPVTNDFISPKVETTQPSPFTDWEAGFIGINEMYQSIRATNPTWSFTDGMVKLVNFRDTTPGTPAHFYATGVSRNLAAVVTYQSAKRAPDGSYSLNWTYPSVERIGSNQPTDSNR